MKVIWISLLILSITPCLSLGNESDVKIKEARKLTTLFFRDADLKQGEYKKIMDLVKEIEMTNPEEIILTGFNSNDGTEEANKEIVKLRLSIVSLFLSEYKEKIRIIEKPNCCFFYSNNLMNQRVEIILK